MPFLSGIPAIPLPLQMTLIKRQRFQDIFPGLTVWDAFRNIPAGVFVPESDFLDLIRLILVHDVLDHVRAERSVL